MSEDPLAALDRAIDRGLWAKAARRPIPLGAIVVSAPGEDREALSRLTSDRVRTVRQDVVALYIETDPVRAAKLKFDSRLRRR